MGKNRALNIILSWRMFIFWVIIVGTVFVAHATSGFLESLVVEGNKFGWIFLFLWYLAWISVVGSIFAYIFMGGKNEK